MSVQFVLLHEGLVAQVALKWFLAGVLALVVLEMRALGEGLVAVTALQRLLRAAAVLVIEYAFGVLEGAIVNFTDEPHRVTCDHFQVGQSFQQSLLRLIQDFL